MHNFPCLAGRHERHRSISCPQTYYNSVYHCLAGKRLPITLDWSVEPLATVKSQDVANLNLTKAGFSPLSQDYHYFYMTNPLSVMASYCLLP